MIQLDIIFLNNVIPIISIAFSYLYNTNDRSYFSSRIDTNNTSDTKHSGITDSGIYPLYIGVISIYSS